MNRRPKIIEAPDFCGRTLVISDIHGALDLYLELLERCGYHPGRDRLILLGDLCEKGPQSLALVRTVMKQFEAGENIFCLMGNCDFVAKNVLLSYRLDYLRQVLLSRSHSLIHEMIAKAGLPAFDVDTDMDLLAQQLRRRFLPELAFLNDLPHVLITPSFLFAHCAISDEETIAQDFREVMARPMFLRDAPVFSKTLVVGHMPVSEYCRQVASFNVRFERKKNIIDIDGGCMVNKAGQLNALIIEGAAMRTVSIDALPKARVVQTVRPFNPTPFYLNWNNGMVDVLKWTCTQARVHSSWLNRTFWVDRSFLTDGRATDYTNYILPLEEGTIVSVVRRCGRHTLVKVYGQLGWCESRLLEPAFNDKTTVDPC